MSMPIYKSNSKRVDHKPNRPTPRNSKLAVSGIKNNRLYLKKTYRFLIFLAS